MSAEAEAHQMLDRFGVPRYASLTDRIACLGDRFRDYQKIAIYLADCHAATATYDGMLRSTSKSRRKRFALICERAIGMLRSGHYAGPAKPIADISQSMAYVIRRLEEAVKELEEK